MPIIFKMLSFPERKKQYTAACMRAGFTNLQIEVMKDIEYILDFSINLGCALLECGAPLERANDTMERVCKSYGLCDISIFSLNSLISLSARDNEGNFASRQISVPSMDIHLEKISRYNALSRKVCSKTPDPAKLEEMLYEAGSLKEYNRWTILTGRMIATVSLTFIFGGTWWDVLATCIIVFGLYWLIIALGRARLNQIIVNILCMLYCGAASALFVKLSLGENFFIMIISCSMVMLPGIPLVNAARNLLCGNEMNGILEILKALFETMALVLGLIAAIFLFGGGLTW